MKKQKQKNKQRILDIFNKLANKFDKFKKTSILSILGILAIGVLFQLASYISPNANFNQLLEASVTRPQKDEQKTEQNPEQITAEDETKYRPGERYRYEIIENIPKQLTLEPDEEKELSLTIKNTGKLSWYLDENHPKNLTLGNYSKNSLDQEKISIKDEKKKSAIKPNEELSFNFKIKAPQIPGAYSETFMPLVGNEKWINNNRLALNVVVGGDQNKSYSYKTIEKNASENISKKTSKPITLKVENTGKVPWYNSGQFPLQLMLEPDSWPSAEPDQPIIANMEEPLVMPGKIATFIINLKAPDAVSNFELKANLQIKDIYTFENPLFWEINVSQKQVALTFDDGYGDIDAVIDLLNSEGVRGTFFMLGCVAQQNPDAMRRIVDEGHLLASHSYCHPDFRTLSADQIRWQLSETRKIMQEITGHDVFPYFRYPYGAMNAKTHAVLDEEGWKYFHWTQSTGDYKHHENSAEGRKQIFYYSTLNPPEQANVLMHIISKSSLAVLPEVIKWYREHGYTFVTVDEF